MRKKIILSEIILSLIALFPLLGIVLEGLKNKEGLKILFESKSIESLVVTTEIVIIAIVINIIIGTPVAIFMAKEKFKYKYIVEILIYLPLIIPALVTTIGIQYFFIKIDLIDTILGVAIVHSLSTLPYYIQSIREGYKTLNKNYEKLGKILGMNKSRVFYKMLLPMILPSFIVAISMVIIVSLVQYITTFIIGGGTIITYPMLMMPYLMDGNIVTGSVYSFWYLIYTLIMILIIKFFLSLVYRKRVKK